MEEKSLKVEGRKKKKVEPPRRQDRQGERDSFLSVFLIYYLRFAICDLFQMKKLIGRRFLLVG